MSEKEKRRIRGVLFDFDGTLTFPGAIDFAAIKEELRCPPDMPILEYLDTVSLAEQAPLLAILEAREEAAAQASLPNTGAEALLSALKIKGLPVGIITRNSMPSVRAALEKFTLITVQDFAAVITREKSLPKPHPQGVYHAAQHMGISPSELMVVGDFRFDVLAGKAAGALTVLLQNSEKSVMSPGDPQPDHTIHHLEEILTILDGHSSA
jgi:haloacid dehalogenase superfamily, subfamily IA, variant 3 with third motif having DD or ED